MHNAGCRNGLSVGLRYLMTDYDIRLEVEISTVMVSNGLIAMDLLHENQTASWIVRLKGVR